MKRALTVVVAFGVISALGLAQTQQGWEVAGTVTTDRGPVKDAYVFITGPEFSARAKTDGQGRYSLKGVVPGRYSARVQKEDNTSEPRSRSLSLTNGLRLRIDFPIPKGAVVSGRVLDRDRQPVSGVVVQAMSKFVPDNRVRLIVKGGDKTNDLGEYRIPYLPDGAYVVAVTSNPLPLRKRAPGSGAEPGRGYPPITFYPGTRVLDTAAALELRSGEEQTGLDIVLQREATKCISFRVGGVFTGSRASAGTDLGVLLEEGLGSANSPTLARGQVTAGESYDICGLAPGEYRLHLSSITTRPFKILGYQMTDAVVDKQNVDLGSLEPLAPGELRGTVAVKDTKPGDSIPPGVRVRVVSRESPLLNVGTPPEAVQPDGTFVLSRVFMDDYGLRVENLPGGYYVIRASQLGRSVLDSGLRPGNGDVQITLGADGPAVRGRVLAADDAAIPDASVFLVPKGPGRPLVVQSDQTGSYQFTSGVQPGDYRLAAASLMEGRPQDTATASRLAANGMELKLSPRESRTIDLRTR
jgi:hypothetical protein